MVDSCELIVPVGGPSVDGSCVYGVCHTGALTCRSPSPSRIAVCTWCSCSRHKSSSGNLLRSPYLPYLLVRGIVTLSWMFAYVHLYAVTVNQYLLNDLVSAFSCSSPSVSQCACIPVVKLARCFSPPVPHFSVFVHLILHCPCCTVSDCYCVDYVFRPCSVTWGSGFIAKRP